MLGPPSSTNWTTDPGRSIRALPTLFVIDRRSTVREVFVGIDGASLSRLEQRVDQLLAEPAP